MIRPRISHTTKNLHMILSNLSVGKAFDRDFTGSPTRTPRRLCAPSCRSAGCRTGRVGTTAPWRSGRRTRQGEVSGCFLTAERWIFWGKGHFCLWLGWKHRIQKCAADWVSVPALPLSHNLHPESQVTRCPRVWIAFRICCKLYLLLDSSAQKNY